MQPSNTPPDGDFVRYIDRLTAAQAVARSRPVAGAPVAVPGLPPVVQGLKSGTRIPFMRHVRWAFVLWVATQILGRFVPGAGFLFIPMLAAYAAWLIYRLRSQPPGTFVNKMAALARRAAEDARKAPSTFPKNKP
ncbi:MULTISPECIES: hypothetical protein [unclassified Polaromonas]|uniref:hypothetical protein n=1 Tax=unclassified Polaromonas TaxID=2638319 RepID=UPI0018CBE6F6|nr:MULTISPECIES: hypothetical protein [unclassified Polaromonas]MBG6071212.1 hypothetical protein [Polaromonas sp. CG_9.7]MBG6113212.1 hypothetical protein [Polaromonas sp. CG_9.2]MDH6185744.1 hypothetical protein [Polaromonas sp. CG_23.6]